MKFLNILSIFLIGFILAFTNVNAATPFPYAVTTKNPSALTTKKAILLKAKDVYCMLKKEM
jgi:hypothetical protein